jgi:hypothetical protein
VHYFFSRSGDCKTGRTDVRPRYPRRAAPGFPTTQIGPTLPAGCGQNHPLAYEPNGGPTDAAPADGVRYFARAPGTNVLLTDTQAVFALDITPVYPLCKCFALQVGRRQAQDDLLLFINSKTSSKVRHRGMPTADIAPHSSQVCYARLPPWQFRSAQQPPLREVVAPDKEARLPDRLCNGISGWISPTTGGVDRCNGEEPTTRPAQESTPVITLPLTFD